MKIAQIAGYKDLLSPDKVYAISEVAYNLVEGVVKKGHRVTAFAPKGSKTLGIIPKDSPRPASITMKGKSLYITKFYYQLLNMEIAKKAKNFDIIHTHHLGFIPFSEIIKTPCVATLHGGGFSEKEQLLNKFCKKIKYIAISKRSAQLAKKNGFNIVATIYNGINLKPFTFNPKPKNYLSWLGRLDPEKGAHTAVKVAKKSKQTLKLAGIVDTVERKKYYQKEIKPYLSKNISFVGRMNSKTKAKFLANSRALLFPIHWEEPFGLVMVEAMACGTPVIAFNRGAAPEIVKHGKTGFIVKNEKEMIAAIKNIDKIKREDCRARVEKYFASEIMVENYLKLYKKIIKNKK